MSTTLVWFRHDRWRQDNPALCQAAKTDGHVIPIAIQAPAEEVSWAPGAGVAGDDITVWPLWMSRSGGGAPGGSAVRVIAWIHGSTRRGRRVSKGPAGSPRSKRMLSWPDTTITEAAG